MKRGDIVTFAGPGDYGKPRPAVIIQTDLLPETDSVLVCLFTSDGGEDLLYRRISIVPSPGNGLRQPSHIMPEKILAVRRARCRNVIGRLELGEIEQLNASLALAVGLLD